MLIAESPSETSIAPLAIADVLDISELSASPERVQAEASRSFEDNFVIWCNGIADVLDLNKRDRYMRG